MDYKYTHRSHGNADSKMIYIYDPGAEYNIDNRKQPTSLDQRVQCFSRRFTQYETSDPISKPFTKYHQHLLVGLCRFTARPSNGLRQRLCPSEVWSAVGVPVHLLRHRVSVPVTCTVGVSSRVVDVPHFFGIRRQEEAISQIHTVRLSSSSSDFIVANA